MLTIRSQVAEQTSRRPGVGVARVCDVWRKEVHIDANLWHGTQKVYPGNWNRREEDHHAQRSNAVKRVE